MSTQPESPPTPLVVEVARRIRVAMADRGVDQQTVAGAVGILPAGFSRRMKGQPEWSLTELVRLADYFGIPVATFTADLPRTVSAPDPTEETAS